MRLLAAVLVGALLSIPAAAHADDTMTKEQAARAYLKAMCPLDWHIAEYNVAEPSTLAEARQVSRHLSRYVSRATSGITEAPVPWPTRPRVMPQLRKLVRALVATNRSLGRAAHAQSVRVWLRESRAVVRAVRRMKPPVAKLNAKLGLPYRHLDDNCADAGMG